MASKPYSVLERIPSGNHVAYLNCMTSTLAVEHNHMNVRAFTMWFNLYGVFALAVRAHRE